MKLNVLAIVALVSTSLADQYTVDSMKHITAATIDYHKSLSEWDGSIRGAWSLQKKSKDLANTIRAASDHPKAKIHEIVSPEVDGPLMDEGFAVAHNLVKEMTAAIDTAISKKPQLEAIPLVGKMMALRTFKDIQDAGKGLATIFGPKVSDDRLQESKGIVDEIHAQLDRGVAHFEL